MNGIKSRKNFVSYIRNFIFGAEDSLVSTAGLVSGIAIADISKSSILTAGSVLIIVEAFSMAAGSLLSEHSAEEYENHTEVSLLYPIKGALIMFFAYFIFGFIPLLPYLFLEIKYSFWVSIFISLLSLFALGGISSKVFGTKVLRHGFEMLLIGGAAIIIGIVAGIFAGPVFNE